MKIEQQGRPHLQPGPHASTPTRPGAPPHFGLCPLLVRLPAPRPVPAAEPSRAPAGGNRAACPQRPARPPGAPHPPAGAEVTSRPARSSGPACRGRPERLVTFRAVRATPAFVSSAARGLPRGRGMCKGGFGPGRRGASGERPGALGRSRGGCGGCGLGRCRGRGRRCGGAGTGARGGVRGCARCCSTLSLKSQQDTG